jgi:hypothetical protein
MHKYRLYIYDAEDRLIAPVMGIFADDDAAATEQAEQMLDGVRADLRMRIAWSHVSQESRAAGSGKADCISDRLNPPVTNSMLQFQNAGFVNGTSFCSVNSASTIRCRGLFSPYDKVR